MEKPFQVFCCYAREDQPYLLLLKKHLKPLERGGLITVQADIDVSPGAEWEKEIHRHLNAAHIILLLVSPDFIASDYCYSVKMQQALERHAKSETRVLPIILRPTANWKELPIGKLQALPQNATPLTLWPNEDEAWVDVAQGIWNAVEELLQNGTAPGKKRPLRPAPFPPVWNVPYRYSFFFTGREQVVEQLFATFTSPFSAGAIPLQALIGMGGMGKTQTAVEYAYRYRQQYETVLWMNAETEDALLVSFKTAAELLKCPAAHLQSRQSLIASMQEWFRNMIDWLLILDNADQIALIEPFLPLSARGHILLTTRATALGGLAQPLPLTSLTDDDGALCLLRRATYLSSTQQLSEASPASVKAARELSQLMNGLPLALEQAGAYIETTGRGITGYLDLYRTYRLEIQRDQHGEVPNYRYPVAFAWNLSREIVRGENPVALELLHLCAFLAPEAIPYEIFTKGTHLLGPTLGSALANPLALDRMVALLRKHSLIKNEVDQEADISRLIIHPVLQEILQDGMDPQTRYLMVQRIARAVAHALPFVSWQVMQAHARRCLSWIERWNLATPEAYLIRQHLAEEHF